MIREEGISLLSSSSENALPIALRRTEQFHFTKPVAVIL